jgi:hypothetical protein
MAAIFLLFILINAIGGSSYFSPVFLASTSVELSPLGLDAACIYSVNSASISSLVRSLLSLLVPFGLPFLVAFSRVNPPLYCVGLVTPYAARVYWGVFFALVLAIVSCIK